MLNIIVQPLLFTKYTYYIATVQEMIPAQT